MEVDWVHWISYQVTRNTYKVLQFRRQTKRTPPSLYLTGVFDSVASLWPSLLLVKCEC
jgi:hypothetical protein